jgi:hypothetical protein
MPRSASKGRDRGHVPSMSEFPVPGFANDSTSAAQGDRSQECGAYSRVASTSARPKQVPDWTSNDVQRFEG